jgi:FkbM family methyltransferase
MKALIKRVLNLALGPARAAETIRKLRGQPLIFSEAELIIHWFDSNRRRGVMVDVGAHFGESLSPYLERGWKIHAFEPDPTNRKRLKQNVEGKNIQLYECAVSDREDDGVAFFASPESDGISGLSAFRETHHQVDTVRLTTLTRVLSEANESKVDYLKIDTEGHDLFVLRGFPWSRIQPDVVMCEFEDSKTIPLGYNYIKIGDYLLGKGYIVFLSEWFPIKRYGANHKWRQWRSYPCQLQDKNGWGNLVAFKIGHDISKIDSFLKRFKNS